MTLQFSLGSAAPETVDAPCVVVGVYENGVLTSAAARVDTAAHGAIKRQVESGDITGKAGTTAVLFAPLNKGRGRETWDEHAAILRAVLAGDAELASMLAARHVYSAAHMQPLN